MGLTGAYLVLVEQLSKQGVIDGSETIRRLQVLSDSIDELPHARTWLEVTMKHLQDMIGAKK